MYWEAAVTTEKVTTHWVDRVPGPEGARRRAPQFRVDIWHREDGWLYMLPDRPPEWTGPYAILEAAIDAARMVDASR